MKKIKKSKNILWDNVEWEDVVIEDDNQKEYRQEWEYVDWEKDIEIVGYYVGIRKTKNGKILGLVMKQLPVEENEPICYAFSIPVDLRRKLEHVEKNNRILHGIKIKLVDIVNIGDKKMYKFDVKTTGEVKINDEVIMQYLSFTPEKLTGGSVI